MFVGGWVSLAGPSLAGAADAGIVTAPGGRDAADQPVVGVQDSVLKIRGDLDRVVAAFPRGNIVSEGLFEFLPERLLGILEGIRRDAGSTEVQVAFVVESSAITFAPSILEVVLAAIRNRMPAGRYALIACGQDEGAWAYRVEVPFTSDTFALARGARRIEKRTAGPDIRDVWLGLSQLPTLSWNPKGQVHVVLLADDRHLPGFSGPPRSPPPMDRSVVTQVNAWAQGHHATLHTVRLAFSDYDEPYDPERDRGLPLQTFAGLFRNGSYIKARSSAEFDAAIASALAPLAADNTTPVDLALVVDRGGEMGQHLSALKCSPSLTRFAAGSGHRTALVRWGNGIKLGLVMPLTAQSGALASALGALRKGPLGTWPADHFYILERARRLNWSPRAQKVVLFLTAAPLGGGSSGDPVLDWAEENSVKIAVIEPRFYVKGASHHAH